MKFTTLAVTTLVAVASVASANDYQPALRALAVPEPVAPVAAEHSVQQPAAATASVDAAGKEATHADNKDGDEKKKKEWGGGGFGWGGPDGEARGEAGEAAVVGVAAADGVAGVASAAAASAAGDGR
ncbi:hypothetical protein GN958_ATG14424 [Phytophthora infestans]|uniref:Uncharacterized protein n=1 Tax=Phytophthora infestans TaxID=4787 RepID=A0A8S9U7A3_PHYIN|nr:hypothetical protein GN958_ATG14424 [Phytophthora infestans]